jgi:hypothetical protein
LTGTSLDLRDQPISAARNVFDETRFARTITQSGAQVCDRLVHHVVADDDARPHAVQQRSYRHDVRRGVRQRDEYVHGLRFDARTADLIEARFDPALA